METRPNTVMIQDSKRNKRNLISEYGILIVDDIIYHDQTLIFHQSRKYQIPSK